MPRARPDVYLSGSGAGGRPDYVASRQSDGQDTEPDPQRRLGHAWLQAGPEVAADDSTEGPPLSRAGATRWLRPGQRQRA